MEALKICPQCGNDINHIPAGVSRKTGKPYNEFWACSQKCGYVWRPVKEPKGSGEALIMEEIVNGFKEVNERLDKLIAYITTNLPKK